jgi:hypothetical protein
VDAAEFFGRKIDHPLHVRVFRHVGADERRFAGKFLNLSDDLCPFFFATARSVRLLHQPSKFERGGFADTGCSSGHECNFA